jgi:hypothetical protein
MINLNTEQGIVKLESWADIEGIPGFVKNFDLKNAELETVRGNYKFSDKVQCGLSSCHTPHFKGYLVGTKDGHCTNIGKDCGTKFFGLDFETLSRQFDRDVEDNDNRDNLHSFKNRISPCISEVTELRKEVRGADWVNQRVGDFDSPGKTPKEILKIITNANRDGAGRSGTGISGEAAH